ncbi:MAG: DsbA family oxidoreductase [Filomicrobium sp.]
MTVQINVTSDFICPWCYIGHARLSKAIELLSEDVDVDVRWHPYELNPSMPPEGMERKVYRSLKFGSWARSQQLDAQTVLASENDDVTFNYDLIERTPNSFAAHRLSALAANQGKQSLAAHAILEAYFRDGRDIGDADVLREIASEVGIDAEAFNTWFAKEVTTAQVRSEITKATRGVHGVPQFEIAGEVLGGAQPAEVLAQAIRRAAATLNAP